MVAVVPEFDTIVLQVVPPSADLSILYPVIAEPPLSEGGAQVRPICEEDDAVAVTPVGGDGVAIGVVAEAMPDGDPVPIELIAETLYV